jgi:hypothetical protein
MRQLAIEWQASCFDDRGMNMNWISKLARQLAKVFAWQGSYGYSDHIDRDAERVARELELIKMRFPHHA